MRIVSQTNVSHSIALTLIVKAINVVAIWGYYRRVQDKIVMGGMGIHANERIERKAKVALLGLSLQALASAFANKAVILHRLSRITLLSGGDGHCC